MALKGSGFEDELMPFPVAVLYESIAEAFNITNI